ncbi:hypothetical protein J2857_003589 [Neorhizobium galegae]|uniref:hypothetical protein n=1 Tax=Neorhizobium galegae TaxID=399 RepID=UPI001AEAA5A5|nr:hypothetical protein [Neorhizobium galegae]MBP2560820.1 hypothetical protein [Neorhizobium galegae]
MLNYCKMLAATAVFVGLSAIPNTASENLTQLAMTFGDVLGAEKTCGLRFDSEAIKAFVKARVPANDIDFMSTVATSVKIAPMQFNKMPAGLQVAHCTQMERLAAQFKILAK